jgi:hypothetical protein
LSTIPENPASPMIEMDIDTIVESKNFIKNDVNEEEMEL